MNENTMSQLVKDVGMPVKDGFLLAGKNVIYTCLKVTYSRKYFAVTRMK
jgi:hypothetical protein